MDAFPIFVKTLKGTTITIDVHSNDKITDLKQRVADRTAIPRAKFCLNYGGRNLDVGAFPTVADYAIQRESTLQSSLKAAPQYNTKVTLKMPLYTNKNDVMYYIPNGVPPVDSVFGRNLKAIININKLPSETQILHGNKIISSELTLPMIKNIRHDPILHTRVIPIHITDKLSIQYKVFGGGKCIHSSSVEAIVLDDNTFDDNDQKNKDEIDQLIYNHLRQINVDPKYHSQKCPFKAINIICGIHKMSVRLRPYDPKYIETFSTDAINENKFGLIPTYSLQSLYQCFPQCDCCEPKLLHHHHNIIKVEAINPPFNADNRPITVEIVLADISFFMDDSYYICGHFYERDNYEDIKNKIHLQFYPLLKEPRDINQELLITGFVKHYCLEMMPMDVIHVIHRFYPELYGAKYDVKKHNPKLNDEFEQKTKPFIIGGIECCLRFGGFDDEYKGNHLIVDCSTQKDIVSVTILSQMYCKLTKQSFTGIGNVIIGNNDRIKYVKLADFGFESSLECFDCNVQILNMEKGKPIYNYRLEPLQRSYLLEWNIDSELMQLFNKCVDDNLIGYCYESMIFYDMFILRIYPMGFPGEECKFILSIQLIALPNIEHIERNNILKYNEWGIKTQCEIHEAETKRSIGFEEVFTYSRNHTNSARYIMESEEIKKHTQLRFRVSIANIKAGLLKS